MRTAVAFGLLTVVAVAQEKGTPLALDAVLVKPAELPKNVRLVDGVHCVSPEARNYFDKTALEGVRDVPRRRECQSFAAEGRPAGSVLVFEYDDPVVAETLYGLLQDDLNCKDRSAKHPEEIFLADNLVWILSFPFPRPHPAAEWYKERLRKKFHVRAPRDRPELAPLEQQLRKACDAKDADTGLTLLRENAKAADDWAAGQCVLGQFAVMAKDYVVAEKSCRRAIELHEGFEDLMGADDVVASLDSLAVALGAQGKLEEAVTTIRRAAGEAQKTEDPFGGLARSQFRLAGFYARLGKYAEALPPLKAAIRENPQYKELARTDENLAEARKRKEFQELLK